MTISSVPNDINENVLLELLAVVHSQGDHLVHQLRLVTVDVDDRGLDRLGNVGAVDASPGLSRGGGEPDLVVGHNMDHPVDIVVAWVSHLQALVDNALSSHSCITVDDH